MCLERLTTSAHTEWQTPQLWCTCSGQSYSHSLDHAVLWFTVFNCQSQRRHFQLATTGKIFTCLCSFVIKPSSCSLLANTNCLYVTVCLCLSVCMWLSVSLSICLSVCVCVCYWLCVCYRFILVSVWSHDCSAVLLLPDKSRPPLPVYVNSSPSSWHRHRHQHVQSLPMNSTQCTQKFLA